MQGSEPLLARSDRMINLALGIRADRLVAVLSNTSSRVVRVWETENSWGWFSLALELRSQSEESPVVLSRKQREWTKNTPRFWTLRPGEGKQITLDLHDGWWERPPGLDGLADEPLEVRAILSIGPSREADTHDVFVGSVASDWIRAQPPHPWLFTLSKS